MNGTEDDNGRADLAREYGVSDVEIRAVLRYVAESLDESQDHGD
jgi:hypothetical protein